MIYKRNNRKISQQLRINLMDPVVLVFGRYNFYYPSQLLLPPCPPYYPTVDKFYYPPCPPCYLQWTVTVPARISRGQQYSTAISVIKMDFVQQFLALKPEVLFKTVNHTPPTTFLIMLVAICVIVLVMMIIFMVGVCHLCRTTPSISESDESVTLVEQPV